MGSTHDTYNIFRIVPGLGRNALGSRCSDFLPWGVSGCGFRRSWGVKGLEVRVGVLKV